MEIAVFVIGLLLSEIFIELWRIYYRKKANYDCDKCNCYDCPYLHCQYLKNKNNNTNKRLN